MITIEYTVEIATAFTELTDETNKNTNKQWQVAIKCYEGEAHAPGLQAGRTAEQRKRHGTP